MPKPKSPCLDCKLREFSCHDQCVSYNQYKALTKEIAFAMKEIRCSKHSPRLTGRVGYQRKYDSFVTKNELYGK